MDATTVIFYALALVMCASSLAITFARNPLYSAFFLVLTMVSMAFFFFLLQAPFLAGVQLIVYAGAVMVLMVMVLMLLNLKKEIHIFSEANSAHGKKITALVLGSFLGLLAVAALATQESFEGLAIRQTPVIFEVKDLSRMLFTQYLLSFEVLGILLLLTAVGVVVVSRSKGGTHDKP